MKKEEHYIMCGHNPKEWCDSQPIGPFTSDKKAKDEIREIVLKTTRGNTELDMTDPDDYYEYYSVVKVTSIVKPKIKVEVKVSLSSLEELGEISELKEEEPSCEPANDFYPKGYDKYSW